MAQFLSIAWKPGYYLYVFIGNATKCLQRHFTNRVGRLSAYLWRASWGPGGAAGVNMFGGRWIDEDEGNNIEFIC